MSIYFSYRFAWASKNAVSRDVLVIFAASSRLSSSAFATLIEREIDENLQPDEVLVVVREPIFDDADQALREDQAAITAIDRLGGKARVSLASYGVQGQEIRRQQIGDALPNDSEYVEVQFDDFRRRALTHIFQTRHGFVESTASYHFENPSGRHTNRFIRLSNILADRAEIGFIAFCILPYITESAEVIYCDTPSLFTVVAEINDQRRSFGKDPLDPENFGSYDALDDFRFLRTNEAFVLISASSSGSLAKKLIETEEFGANQIAHVLFLGKNKSQAAIVCDLAYDESENAQGEKGRPSVNEADNCPLCDQGSVQIKLRGDQFEFAGPQNHALEIKQKSAPAGLSLLMNRLVGSRIFQVGFGNQARQQHHFHIDADALLQNKEFERRLDFMVRRSIPAGLGYIVAIDNASKKLADRIADSVSDTVSVIEANSLDSITDKTDSAIAIVGAAIESGRSLLDVSRDLRNLVPDAPLLYIVGISKSDEEPRRKSLESSLTKTKNTYPHQFLEIERIVVPAPQEPHPWETELRFWQQCEREAPPSDHKLASLVTERRKRLQKTGTPLVDELFVTNGLTSTLELQKGFVFWPPKLPDCASKTQADVYFTVASVLQQLRANSFADLDKERQALRSNWFQQTLLAAGNFGRFNDDIIQASLLRAARPVEINYSDAPRESSQMARLIKRVLDAADKPRGGAAAEFLLALLTKRLSVNKAAYEQICAAEPPLGDETILTHYLLERLREWA